MLVKYNSHGLREDKDYPFEKPKDVFRILAVGDSYTEAKEVELQETYPKVLERLLNSKRKTKTFEVLNLGIAGTGTVRQFIRIRNLGLKFQPDLVIQMICANDLDDNLNSKIRSLYSIASDQVLTYRMPRNITYRLMKSINHTLFNYSNLYWLVRVRLNRLCGVKDIARDRETQKILARTDEVNKWHIMKLLLKETNRILRKNDSIFCISFVPFRRACPEEDRYIQNIRQISAELGVTFLAINDKVRGDEYFYKTDGHWNRLGHQKVGETLYSILESSNLICN